MRPLLGSLIAVTLAAGCAGWRTDPLRASTVTGSTPAERRGQEVFRVHCHACHPWGTAGLGPALNNKPVPGGAIAAQVRLGVGAMPGFSKDVISEEDLDALVAYVEALRRR